MSRTRVHIPPRVVVEKVGVIAHDHRNGVCDAGSDPVERPEWSKHYKKDCQKVTEVRVVCTHTFSDAPTFNGVPAASAKNRDVEGTTVRVNACHEATATSLRTNEAVAVAPFYKYMECHKNFAGESNPLRRRGNESINGCVFRQYDDSGFTKVDWQFVQHSYTLYIFNGATECECNDFRSRYQRCEKEATFDQLKPHYRQYAYEGWSDDRGGRNSDRMELEDYKRAFNNGYFDEHEG